MLIGPVRRIELAAGLRRAWDARSAISFQGGYRSCDKPFTGRAWQRMHRPALEVCMSQVVELLRYLQPPANSVPCPGGNRSGSRPGRATDIRVRALQTPGRPTRPSGHHVSCRVGHGGVHRGQWNVRLFGRHHACSFIELADRLDRVADSLAIERKLNAA